VVLSLSRMNRIRDLDARNFTLTVVAGCVLADVQAAADAAIEWSQAEHLKQEAELAKSFEEQGLKVYTPDVDAFRAHAQQMYLESDLAKSWPEGLLEKINALGV
jgi:TRAP-type C4-dicarboxylate transport system substrate-binding protein